MKKLLNLYKTCKESETIFIITILRFIFNYIFYGKYIIMHQNVTIKGMKNIYTNVPIQIGTRYVGFTHKSIKTLINVHGKIIILGKLYIGRGCRFDVGKNGKILFGKNVTINVNTTFIIQHKLYIGDNTIISWDCQFLDEDFHNITYPGYTPSDNSIAIGNHVWIGCGVKIYKGTVIPDNCVIAANSIVRGIFNIPNSLIAGHPAKIIKNNVVWN